VLTQQLSGLNSASYNPEIDDVKFAHSLASVTTDLKAKHITVLHRTYSPESHPTRLVTTATTEILMLTYQVKASLQELGSYSDVAAAYDSLMHQITDASSGTKCALQESLQSSGGSFSQVIVPDGSSPVIYAVEEVFIHTPVPSSQPTSSPSCPAGFNGRGCTPCPEGTYALPGGTGCIQCPRGTYSDSPGSGSCTACQWPWTTFDVGASACKSISINISIETLAGTLTAVLVLYIAGLSVVDKENFFLMITSTFFPMVDTLSDFFNLVSSTWATEILFHFAWMSIVIPNVVLFVYELIEKRVIPRVFGWSYIQKLLWLRSLGGVPGYFDKPLLTISFYDDVPKLLILCSCWAVSIVAQGLCMIIAAFLYIPTACFIAGMLLTGMVLFASKMIT